MTSNRRVSRVQSESMYLHDECYMKGCQASRALFQSHRFLKDIRSEFDLSWQVASSLCDGLSLRGRWKGFGVLAILSTSVAMDVTGKKNHWVQS